MTTRSMRAIAALTLLIVSLSLGACTQTSTREEIVPEPQQEAAWEVFNDVRSILQQHPFNSDDLGYKTPPGVALYARSENVAPPGEAADLRYVIAVVNLADGVIFAEQAPRGIGIHRFDTLEEYNDWNWRETYVSLPELYEAAATYGEQIDWAEKAFYLQEGRFAAADELIAFSASPDNFVPDVTPNSGFDFSANADQYGYIVVMSQQGETALRVDFGYTGSPSFVVEDLDAFIHQTGSGILIPGVDGHRPRPFEFVTVNPLDADEDGGVAAVPYPEPPS